MAQHNDLGLRGERIAYDYLRRIGYRVLEKNWIFNRCEIDIIASNTDFIIFVEVKTRKTRFWGNPEDSVSENKIKRIVHAADHYLNENGIEKPARFDIISIVFDGKNMEIDHIEDAFMAPLNLE